MKSDSILGGPEWRPLMLLSLVLLLGTPTTVVGLTDKKKSPVVPANNHSVLVLVEPSPYTYVSGYANRFQALFRHLDSRSNHFEVVTVDVHSTDDEKPTEHLGKVVHHAPAIPVPVYKELGLCVDWKLQIPRVIRRMKPDILHASSPGLIAFPALLYSRLFQIPLICSYHTHMPVYARFYIPKFLKLNLLCEWLSWQLIRVVHSFFDATVATSPQIVQEFKDHGVPRCFLWEKGVDTDRFHPRFRSKEMRHRLTDGHPDDFLVIYVGRLGKEKRLEELKDVLAKMDHARLAIVGHGPHEAALREHFQGTNTVFTGLLRGDELSEAFASADAFGMPSDSETLGFVVLESMASGVPVVGCNAGGIPHTIRPVEGKGSFLVEPGDIDGYADKLRLLQSDPDLRRRMGKRAREEMLQWSWEDSMAQLRDETYRVATEHKNQRFENQLWRWVTLRPLRQRLFCSGSRPNNNHNTPAPPTTSTSTLA